MARTAPAQLPLWMILLLVLCLSCLAVHFYVESLGIYDLSASSALKECAGHGEDHFIPLINHLLDLYDLTMILTPEISLPRASFSVSPLLPPPNS
jgi:hypothetical protein